MSDNKPSDSENEYIESDNECNESIENDVASCEYEDEESQIYELEDSN